VSANVAVSEPTFAVTSYDPSELLAVAVMLATPEALVGALAAESAALAPEAGAAKHAVIELMGLPLVSSTVACNAAGKAVPATVYCGVPPVAVMLPGMGSALVSEKAAVSAPKVAVTESLPAVLLAVAITWATPDALVTALFADSVALAPPGGGEKVTVWPAIGLPFMSKSVACRAVAKGCPIMAVCVAPPVAVNVGAPGVLVSANVVDTPSIDVAITL
jgi:hypothetical protein